MHPADPSSPDFARAPARAWRRLGAALALIASCAFAAPALAQQSPGSFSLPEPSPTPAPAPQGPVDVREGVVIGPRVIEQPARPTDAPRRATEEQRASTPAPRPIASPSPSPTPSTTPSPRVQAPRVQASPSPLPASSPEVTAPTSASDPGPQEVAADPAPVSEPAGDAAAPRAQAASRPNPRDGLELRVHKPGLIDLVRAYEGWILAGLALLVALLLSLWIAQRRRARAVRLLAPPTLGAMVADAARLSPVTEAEAEAEPPRIDLRLDVVAASRSVMTLTIDVRLTLSNRSDRAVRGLRAAAMLDCARTGVTDGTGTATGEATPLGEIARIGPHQAAVLTGQLRLPVSQLGLIRQGSGRVFIPLVHLTYSGEAVPEARSSFVIGTPSAGGSGRLQPLPVAAPVGGIHGLAAQLVHIPEPPAQAHQTPRSSAAPSAASTAPEPA